MSVIVNTNISAITAKRYLDKSTDGLSKSMERLSSGYRINKAKDDAAGLQISNRLMAQTRGLDVATRNANEGLSMMQIAEGAMSETSNILTRMRDLSIQSANGSNNDGDRETIQNEIISLKDEMNRIAEATSFGGMKLLNGRFIERAFQVGADSGEAVLLSLSNMRADEREMGGRLYTSESKQDSDWTVSEDKRDLFIFYVDQNAKPHGISITAPDGDNIEELATYINGQSDKLDASVTEEGRLQVYVKDRDVSESLTFSGSLADELDMAGGALETVQDVDVSTVGGAQRAIAIMDSAMKYVDMHRAEVGAAQNRMLHSVTNLSNMNENVSDSRSQIKDLDFAKESTQMAKQKIKQEAGTSMLAQAKQAPSAAVGLLG